MGSGREKGRTSGVLISEAAIECAPSDEQGLVETKERGGRAGSGTEGGEVRSSCAFDRSGFLLFPIDREPGTG